MGPSLLVFAGAPLSASLDWDEAYLTAALCEPIARFAGLDQDRDVPAAAEATASRDIPSWRSLSLDRRHLSTGLSQLCPDGQVDQGAAFFTAPDVDSCMDGWSQPPTSSVETVDQVRSQFYEQSYATHEDIPSSQIVSTTSTRSSIYSDESFSCRGSVDSTSFSQEKNIPNAGHLTNLNDVPNAMYLSSIHPQTMTINIIVGIISISPPRPIKTRRGANVELVEVLTGDETKSGFTINFWLSCLQSADGDLRSLLGGLRPQDVVLLRNVALSSFRGKVYGQSLKKEVTKVHLLHRNRIDRTDVGGCYRSADLAAGTVSLQVEKTKVVREWVLRFVGGRPAPKASGQFEAAVEALPPDTQ